MIFERISIKHFLTSLKYSSLSNSFSKSLWQPSQIKNSSLESVEIAIIS